jgi:hypothetical protein
MGENAVVSPLIRPIILQWKIGLIRGVASCEGFGLNDNMVTN